MNMSFLHPTNVVNFSVTQSQNFVKSNVMQNMCGLFVLYAAAYAAFHVVTTVLTKFNGGEGEADANLKNAARGMGTAVFFAVGTLNAQAGWAITALALSHKGMWVDSESDSSDFSFTVLPYIKDIGRTIAIQLDAFKPSLAFPIRNYNTTK